MAEIGKLSDEELEKVAGGDSLGWVKVDKLQSGYLALRTQPNYDYGNEIRGSESYNGQPLEVTGGYTTGPDGRTYVRVRNPRTGKSGWVNINFLSW